MFVFLIGVTLWADPKHIVVIAHRGEHLNHSENTIPAFQGAVDAGADYFETDVRTTRDGRLVLHHDALPESLPLGLPTFDEALAFARGRIGVYVDSKQVTAADAVAAIERHAMQDHVVIYGNPEYLRQVAALRPNLRIMPEARSPDILRTLLKDLRLRVVAFDARDFIDETILIARKAQADIFVDRLGPFDNPASWQDAVDRGATGIQTDHPAELVRYLKGKGYR